MENIADDRLDGMKAISRFGGFTERRGFYLAENGLIGGVFKEGERWVGFKSKIREHYQKKATEAA